MENISKRSNSLRDVSYFRQRYKNRVFARLLSFFVQEAERTGLTKADLARRLGKDPGQINRLLSEPSNLTLDTISDVLLAMDAEAEPPEIVLFANRTKPNYMHPLAAKIAGVRIAAPKITAKVEFRIETQDQGSSIQITENPGALEAV